ncbi:AglZ/HisF2 family acetamidino modification protein [Verrucomicrobia bacterium]|nr:AglZ/HisF2 family acetamidino modification protein [Verrucomicrobiota bacterium]MDA7657485.1 AglZ/HisF2 family acetamidino modification protein [Verrucomicrobiota bacterium]
MLRIRVIPCLQLRGESLVKTVRFGKYTYLGDPANTCRIFNELEVDELSFLDITASKEGREPNFKLLSEISNECFMPVSYGGGITSLGVAEKILQLGFEKIVINSEAIKNPGLINNISRVVGNQSTIVAIDVKIGVLGKATCRSNSATHNSKRDPVEWAREVEDRGAGEILLTSVDREGTWQGFDVKLVKSIVDVVGIPVIAHGGAGTVHHIGRVVKEGGASAVAVGSMVVFQKQGMGVLVNFPNSVELEAVLKEG